MTDSFVESDSRTYRQNVNFISGFNVTADQPWNIGNTGSINSTLNTYNQINPYGGISGYLPLTGNSTSNSNNTINIGNSSTTEFALTIGCSFLINGPNGPVFQYAPASLGHSVFVLYDNGGDVSLDIQNRSGVSTNGNTVIDWGNKYLLRDITTPTVTVDWDNKILSGTWSAQSLQIHGQNVLTTGNIISTNSYISISGSGSTVFLSYIGPYLITGSGTPSGVVSAPLGSIYSDIINHIQYNKFAGGSSNTGWY